MATEVTVGIDIGTTAVKALAVDGDGTVLSRARVPHRLLANHAGELAHDAAEAWHGGVRSALGAVLDEELDVRGVNVAAMVPSMCAVGPDGVPISDGLLYGDARGSGGNPSANPSESGEALRFAGWLAEAHPDAAGYWPAQAVANHALCGQGAIDTVTAMTTVPLFDFTSWDPEVAAGVGVTDVGKLPRIQPGLDAVGRVGAAGGAPLGGGTIDAYAEQLVAGADSTGDVLVILGATLIVWVVLDEWREVDGLWSVPHTVPGKSLLGGPSNAGGLFMNWLAALTGDAPAAEEPLAARVDPGRVPLWQPYLRGERVPLHDPRRRASLTGLDIGMGRDEVRRAAYEASGFALRHILDLSGARTDRLVCTGGGTRDPDWVQALVDVCGLPADVVAVAEGGALGSAFLARVTAGLEESSTDAGRWARSGSRFEPERRWSTATAGRYARYRELAG